MNIVVEKRQRGVFGWIFLVLFWGWNAFMCYALIFTMNHIASEAKNEARDIAIGMNVVFTLFVWGMGSLIFGSLTLATRGKRVLIQQS